MAEAVLTPADLGIFIFAKGVGMALDIPPGPGPEEMMAATEDLRKVQGSALIIGGLAVIHYGYRRLTDDIDILYANSDGKILERLKPYFKVVLSATNGWHELKHRKTGVRLELIPEGGLGTHGFIPWLKAAGSEGAFISLLGLVWLKLISERGKDTIDIVELAKVKPEELAALRDKLPEELKGRFAELLAQAQRELANDPWRQNRERTKRADAGSVSEAPGRYAKKKRAARTKRRTEEPPGKPGK
ncbi:MAG: hypothetical protein ABSE73_08660 [Planctomycetota bacterium]